MLCFMYYTFHIHMCFTELNVPAKPSCRTYKGHFSCCVGGHPKGTTVCVPDAQMRMQFLYFRGECPQTFPHSPHFPYALSMDKRASWVPLPAADPSWSLPCKRHLPLLRLVDDSGSTGGSGIQGFPRLSLIKSLFETHSSRDQWNIS